MLVGQVEFKKQDLEIEFDEIDLCIRDKVEHRINNLKPFLPKKDFILLSFDVLEMDTCSKVIFIEDSYDDLDKSIKDMNWDQSEYFNIDNIECKVFNSKNKEIYSKVTVTDTNDETTDDYIYDYIMESIEESLPYIKKVNKKWIDPNNFYMYSFKGNIYTVSKGFNYLDIDIENSGKDYFKYLNMIIDITSKDFPYERDIDIKAMEFIYDIKTTNDPKKLKKLADSLTKLF